MGWNSEGKIVSRQCPVGAKVIKTESCSLIGSLPLSPGLFWVITNTCLDPAGDPLDGECFLKVTVDWCFTVSQFSTASNLGQVCQPCNSLTGLSGNLAPADDWGLCCSDPFCMTFIEHSYYPPPLVLVFFPLKKKEKRKKEGRSNYARRKCAAMLWVRF